MSNFTGKEGHKKLKKSKFEYKNYKNYFLIMKYGQKNWEQKEIR